MVKVTEDEGDGEGSFQDVDCPLTVRGPLEWHTMASFPVNLVKGATMREYSVVPYKSRVKVREAQKLSDLRDIARGEFRRRGFSRARRAAIRGDYK